MKSNHLPAALLLAALLPAAPLPATSATQQPDMGQVASTVGRILESAHYTRRKLDDEQSRQVLQRYLELLDYNRLFFTREDVEEFERKHGSTLDDDIFLGNLTPAYEIYDRFLQRVENRVAKVEKFLAEDFKFDSKATVQINRDKAPWPADEADADRIWKARLEGELLQATLARQATEEKAAKKKADPAGSEAPAPSGAKPKASDTEEKAPAAATSEKPSTAAPAPPARTPKEQIARRYSKLLKSLKEETRADQANTFLSALAQSYDPHSEYLSQRELDNFNIQMGLSLVGIGAVLRSDDGYAKIVELVPGGPADRDGRLKVNDKILAVAQGDGEFEDVVDMKLDKVVERIRGKKGTVVRLQVQPINAADPSKLEVIDITRDEVKLKEQEAKAQVIEVPGEDGRPKRLGWISLPSFYADMDKRGARNAKSTTRDVAQLLGRLKKENIEGLVVDLRRDGGGSLDEAIKLTGLFIPNGPVVQAKDTNGNIVPMNDTDTGVLYDGPMVVLMNRLSASASEIFAAALQDYGRAVVVGDTQSFGKGTVQTMLDVDRFMPLFASGKSGALKLTIQKFYRVKGGSTQLRGVNSDIVLPSPTDHPEVGEVALKNPLPYDEVPARRITPAGDLSEILPVLSGLSSARTAANPEFRYIEDDMGRVHQRLKDNTISLNLGERRAEISAEKERREQRKLERQARSNSPLVAYELTLDTVDQDELQRVSLDKPPKKSLEAPVDPEDGTEGDDSNEPFVDPVRDEALNILSDLVRLQRQPVTASAKPGSAPATP